ncbi:hypothetical protein [Polyangium spumosum]|uniref:Uncharacterized protein n=1 Tax=Polyangium spumosum TaxID=889282 RepID=A0A6N7PU00_9BACT|nr:hypothetical protein [Polyangium spumosum]MRG95463.1 hypothetical protein [Polyangium spumosum]
MSGPQRTFGAERIAGWAYANGFAWSPFPGETWFRQWEPYDNIAPPGHYLHAVTRQTPHGPYVLVEPWYAVDLDTEPLERTVFAYATHPRLVRRAAMRVGEHFVTRVAYLESPPPPTVTIGDKLWDQHVTTFAASPAEAAAAFPPPLRALLASWGFSGHVEMRPGGLALFMAGLRPVAEHYQRLLGVTREVLHAAVG